MAGTEVIIKLVQDQRCIYGSGKKIKIASLKLPKCWILTRHGENKFTLSCKYRQRSTACFPRTEKTISWVFKNKSEIAHRKKKRIKLKTEKEIEEINKQQEGPTNIRYDLFEQEQDNRQNTGNGILIRHVATGYYVTVTGRSLLLKEDQARANAFIIEMNEQSAQLAQLVPSL